MNKTTEKVLALFLKLSPSERSEAIAKLNEFLTADASKQANFSESIQKQAGVPLGPMDSGRCPYCGK